MICTAINQTVVLGGRAERLVQKKQRLYQTTKKKGQWLNDAINRYQSHQPNITHEEEPFRCDDYGDASPTAS